MVFEAESGEKELGFLSLIQNPGKKALGFLLDSGGLESENPGVRIQMYSAVCRS